MIRVVPAALAVASFCAKAQDLEPRAYSNAPVGLNFLIAGYGYTGGGVATDPALPIADAQVEVHSTVLAYARSLDVFGKSAKFDVVLPYAWASGSATAMGQFRDREIAGFADPRVHFSFNFYGAPALSIQDFSSYQQDTIAGVSVEVTAPGGQYDAEKLLNIGTNRWSIKPEIGISKRLGPVTLEFAGGVRFSSTLTMAIFSAEKSVSRHPFIRYRDISFTASDTASGWRWMALSTPAGGPLWMASKIITRWRTRVWVPRSRFQ